MPKHTEKHKSVTILMSADGHERVDRFAKDRGANISGVMRMALVKYMKENGVDIDVDDLMVGYWGGKRSEKQPA